MAGLALWAIMVPEGMAYSAIVGVPPIMGSFKRTEKKLVLGAIIKFGGARRVVAGGGVLNYPRKPIQAVSIKTKRSP